MIICNRDQPDAILLSTKTAKAKKLMTGNQHHSKSRRDSDHMKGRNGPLQVSTYSHWNEQSSPEKAKKHVGVSESFVSSIAGQSVNGNYAMQKKSSIASIVSQSTKPTSQVLNNNYTMITQTGGMDTGSIQQSNSTMLMNSSFIGGCELSSMINIKPKLRNGRVPSMTTTNAISAQLGRNSPSLKTFNNKTAVQNNAHLTPSMLYTQEQRNIRLQM